MQCAFSSSVFFRFLVFFTVESCSMVFIVVGIASSWGAAVTAMGVTVGLGAMVVGAGNVKSNALLWLEFDMSNKVGSVSKFISPEKSKSEGVIPVNDVVVG
jgi:Zn-dependent alcohol dehydrogenase